MRAANPKRGTKKGEAGRTPVKTVQTDEKCVNNNGG